MENVVLDVVDGVARMDQAKAERGQGPPDDLREFVDLPRGVDWSAETRPMPPAATIPGLRHFPAAIAAAYAGGLRPIVGVLRTCVGIKPRQAYHAESDWSRPRPAITAQAAPGAMGGRCDRPS